MEHPFTCIYFKFLYKACDGYFGLNTPVWLCVWFSISFSPSLPLCGLATSASSNWILKSSKFCFIFTYASNSLICSCLVAFIICFHARILIFRCVQLPLLQFRPVLPTQQGQSFIPAPSQQFRPGGPGFSPSNVGMPTIQSQPVQFSQPMQQFPPRPGQPVHSAMPSSQAIPALYGQTNRPLTAGSPQSHHTGPAMNNHMSGLGAPGMPPSSSYTVRSHFSYANLLVLGEFLLHFF